MKRTISLLRRFGRARAARAALALLALLLLGTFAPLRLFRPPAFTATATIAFAPIPLDPHDSRRSRLGPLRFVRGWVLTSDNPAFGGISSLYVAGGDVTTLSDTGVVTRFALPVGGTSSPAHLNRLLEGPGPIGVKSNRDSESMAVAGSDAWVGFERHDEIWRYRRSDWSALGRVRPQAMTNWPNNSGSESLVRFPDGRFLVIAEAAPRGEGTTAALLFDGDPTAADAAVLPLRYRPPEGYRPTDAALLADGRLLVLNRRAAFPEGFSAKLVLAPLPALAPGAVISGEVIATLESPLTVDNMEALSVTQDGGRTTIWIASDDNFFPLQRTLLLEFTLGA